jgi:hypothetical protein
MEQYTIKIDWEGSFSLEEVIRSDNCGGTEADNYLTGRDYGVYQICGPHILCGDNTLLYIGQAHDETFSVRFQDHKRNLLKDDDENKIKIYLGRLENSPQYTPEDNWGIWYRDLDIVEHILIYKYTPHYNSSRLNQYPNLFSYNEIRLLHIGDIGRLRPEDNAPRDYMRQRE